MIYDLDITKVLFLDIETVPQEENFSKLDKVKQHLWEKKAKTLLLQAFANEVLNKIQIDTYKFYVKTLIRKRLQGEKVEMLCAKLGQCRFEPDYE